MSIELIYPTDEPSRLSVRQVNIIRKRLINSWEFDAQFFTKFFPVTSRTRKAYGSVQKTLRRGERWKGVPNNPKSASKLYTPLKNLLNDILLSFDLHEDARRFLNTSRSRILPYATTFSTWPPLFLAGSGKHFISANIQRPLPDYGYGIAVLEVRLENEDELTSRDRLATNMQRLFNHQYNRRYAYGMVISQQSLTLYMFDYSGVLFSAALEYHLHPLQFCAVVSGIASMDASRLGFDTSVSLDTKGRIRTREYLGSKKTTDVIYNVYAILYHSSAFVTRGTVCFLAYEETAPKTLYVIKDAWEPVGELEGKESEGSLLLHAQRRGVLKGVVQIRHSEEIRIKSLRGRMEADSICRNRGFNDARPKLERIHRRIVLTPYGKALHHFSNRKELLVAYHDAIQGHRALHDVAGILHRDIKPSNILIYLNGEEGNRGVLIDLDHAIRIDDKSPYSTKTNIGTYTFMSRDALEGKPQTCLDDLESFYFVLLFIVLSFSGPEDPQDDPNPILDDWRRPMAYMSKGGFFLYEFKERIEPFFGRPFKTLLARLHAIFRTHRLQCISAESRDVPLPVLDPRQVYDEFLHSIRQAIVDLELGDVSDKEESRSSSASDTTDETSNVPRRKLAIRPRASDEQWSQMYSWQRLSDPGKRSHATIQTTACVSRPRRVGAGYGFTKRS